MRSRKFASQLNRKPASRKPAKRIVIVCEGEKTETIYFGQFLDALRAANIQLKVLGKECGSDPGSVVGYADQIRNEDQGIDILYCVFDRDSHANFDQAVQSAEKIQIKIGNDRTFRSIKSYPCFEYWLLLHFSYSRKPYNGAGNHSSADLLIKELEKFIPNYKKSDEASILGLADKTQTAIQNAKKSLDDANKTGELNPSTEVHEIVEAFLAFSQRI
ncbi:RloB family protein [Sphingopyxis sp. Geo48]|uniref:RloB family protein n=1 Tax=Sphingopyxis sp. Geo48 TaxID=545241 RepID=UPI0024B8197B|nr:RloB family protein [Sphingopyxis sp. Geo48]